MTRLNQLNGLDQFFHLWLARRSLLAYREIPPKVYGCGPAPKAVIENVCQHLVLDPHSGCWEWEGSRQANGVPKATVRGSAWCSSRRTVQVPRLMWEMLLGPLPDRARLTACCDSANCVHPAHRVALLPEGRELVAGPLTLGEPDWESLTYQASVGYEPPSLADYLAVVRREVVA
jgi:hypothetical protein